MDEDTDARETIGPSDSTPQPVRAQLITTMMNRAKSAELGQAWEPGDGEDGILDGLVVDLRLKETLAQGGSGMIRLADQPSLDCEVMVKTLLAKRRTLMKRLFIIVAAT